MRSARRVSSFTLTLSLLAACAGESRLSPDVPPMPPSPPPPLAVASIESPMASPHRGMDRATFNRNAVRANLPLYWVADANENGAVDPGEVTSLLFYPTATPWVRDDAFTPEFDRAWVTLQAAATLSASNPPTANDQRRALVAQDLDQGLPTLVRSDFAHAPPADRELVAHMLVVGRLIDQLFAEQNGAKALASAVDANDALSESLFRRNWGPACAAPLGEEPAMQRHQRRAEAGVRCLSRRHAEGPWLLRQGGEAAGQQGAPRAVRGGA